MLLNREFFITRNETLKIFPSLSFIESFFFSRSEKIQNANEFHWNSAHKKNHKQFECSDGKMNQMMMKKKEIKNSKRFQKKSTIGAERSILLCPEMINLLQRRTWLSNIPHDFHAFLRFSHCKMQISRCIIEPYVIRIVFIFSSLLNRLSSLKLSTKWINLVDVEGSDRDVCYIEDWAKLLRRNVDSI